MLPLKPTSKRIEEHLRAKTSKILQGYKGKGGRNREELDAKTYKLSVVESEVESLVHFLQKKKRFSDCVEEWSEKYEKLEEKRKLYEEMAIQVLKRRRKGTRYEKNANR